MNAEEADAICIQLDVKQGTISGLSFDGRLLTAEETAQASEIGRQLSGFPLIERLASLASQENTALIG